MQRDLEIDLLRSFVSVAAHENFTRAATAIGRTQSAVSLQIKRLEDIVGKSLFERTRKSVRITQTGEKLLVHANRILSMNDTALSEIKKPEAEGLVRIGAPDDYATFLLPDILKGLQEEHPRIRFEVTCDNGVDLLKMQRNGQLDIVLATHSQEGLAGEIARYEPLHWVADKNFFVKPDEPLSMVLFPQGCVCRMVALNALEHMNRAWNVAYSTRSIGLMESALLAGSGVSVMEASVIPASLSVVDGLHGLPPLEQVAICVHRRPGDTPEHVTLAADHILASLQHTTRHNRRAVLA